MYMPGLRPGSVSWTIYQDFAAAMRDAGGEFMLLTDGEPPPHPVAHTEFLGAADTARVLDRVFSPISRTRSLLQHTARLTGWLREHPDTEIFYVEMIYPLGAALRAAGRRAGWDGALIATPMGEDFINVPEMGYGFQRHAYPRRQADKVMSAAAGVRCISPLVREYADRFGKPARVIPLNLANATFTSTPAGPNAPAPPVLRCLADPEAPFVLSLGRLHPFKGLHVLVDALTHLPEAELVIAGPTLEVAGFGDYAAYLRERARQRGIERRVHLVGPVPHAEVTRLMGAAAVVAVPSIHESLNRVCAEATAAGTPFVVTRTTGIAHLVQADGVGLIVDPDDDRALADALRQVLTGAWRRDPAAGAAFLEQFRAANIAPTLLEFMAEVSGRA